MNPKINKLESVSIALAVLSMLVAHYLVVQAPLDAVQQWPQKIFYFHVSAAWGAYAMLAVATVAAVRTLLTEDADIIEKWTPAFTQSTEVALVFLTIVNVTGPIWGKPIWGTWWSWDPRLTTNFILWLTLAVAVMLRTSLPFNVRNSRVLAAVSIFAAANVPVVHYSVIWWNRTLHPEPVVMQEKIGGGLDPAMVPALLGMLAAFSFAGVAFMLISYRQERYKLAGEM